MTYITAFDVLGRSNGILWFISIGPLLALSIPVMLQLVVKGWPEVILHCLVKWRYLLSRFKTVSMYRWRRAMFHQVCHFAKWSFRKKTSLFDLNGAVCHWDQMEWSKLLGRGLCHTGWVDTDHINCCRRTGNHIIRPSTRADPHTVTMQSRYHGDWLTTPHPRLS